MTTIVNSDWTNDVSGAFATPLDWTPTGVPTFANDDEFDVYIGGAYTQGSNNFIVTSAANETVGFLDIGGDATLSITKGVFSVASHVNFYSNAYNYGTIKVALGSTLSFGIAGSPSGDGGEIYNLGVLSVAGVLSLAAPYFAILGGGALTLSGSIVGANTNSITYFDNEIGAINGSGAIGTGATLFLTNHYAGTIDANTTKALTINTGVNQILNSGVIETTGAGGLVIESDLENDGELIASGAGALKIVGAEVRGGGDVTVDDDATLILSNGQLSLGGVLSVTALGLITTVAGDTTGVGSDDAFAGDVLSGASIDDEGSIVIANNSRLSANAFIEGDGVVKLNALVGKGSAATTLEVFGTGLSVDNNGGLSMSDSLNNRIVSNGAGVQLTNDTLVSGAGTIGDGWLRFVNLLGANVTADDSVALTIAGDTKAVADSSENENYNAGTITSSGAGGLVLSAGGFANAGYLIENGTGALSLTNVAINSGGGVVSALSGKITLANAQIYNEKKITIAAGAMLTTTKGDTGDAIYTIVENAGAINVVAGSTMIVSSLWTNTGSINLGGALGRGVVEIEADNAWQLSGAGTIDMANVDDKIVSAGAATRLQDKAKMLVGGGVIGDANMEVNITLGATVDATLAHGMTLDGGSLYNAGTLQSDSAGGLTIQANLNSPGRLIVDSGAKIIAQGAVYGAGKTTINGTGSIEFDAENDNDIYFGSGAGGDLILGANSHQNGNIFGLVAGDEIDLRGLAFIAGKMKVDALTSGFGTLDGELFVSNGTTDSAPLYLEGDFTAATLAANHLAFAFASDGHLISGTAHDGTLVKLVSTS